MSAPPSKSSGPRRRLKKSRPHWTQSSLRPRLRQQERRTVLATDITDDTDKGLATHSCDPCHPWSSFSLVRRTTANQQSSWATCPAKSSRMNRIQNVRDTEEHRTQFTLSAIQYRNPNPWLAACPDTLNSRTTGLPGRSKTLANETSTALEDQRTMVSGQAASFREFHRSHRRHCHGCRRPRHRNCRMRSCRCRMKSRHRRRSLPGW